MYKFKKIGIIGVALFLVLYILSSFIQANLDCSKWSPDSRAVMCGWWAVFFIISIVAILDPLKD